MDYTFDIIAKKSLPNLDSQRFCPIFTSGSLLFYILYLGLYLNLT